MSVADTQTKLGKIITKPKLTEQLLARPPFRFLHDIVTAVTQATGFGEGLFGEDEANSENIKEKQAKINYLTKIINCVGYALNIQVEAKPAKIVAGLEAEQTNLFLQQLAEAAGNSSLDWKGAVAKTLGIEAPAAAAPAAPPADSKEDAEKEKKRKKKKEEEKAAEAEAASAAAPAESEEAKEERRRKEKEKEREERKKKKKEKEGEEAEAAPAPAPAARPPSSQKTDDAARPPSGQLERKSSAILARDDTVPKAADSVPNADEEEKKRPARPMSARPAPPKVASNVRTVEKKPDPAAEKVSDGGPGVSNLILEKAKPEDDDDIIVQGPADQDAVFGQDGDGGENHGKLMRGILESKREAEEAAAKEKEEAQAKKDAAGGIIIHRDKKKEGTNFEKEIDKLRENLQVLCRSANPLGRAMDYMQEDLESMVKEMEMWKNEVKIQTGALDEETRATEQSLTPLQSKLLEMDTEIKERINKIDGMKSQILKNDQAIQKMMRMVVS